MNQSKKDIQAWPRNKMRLDQIGLELSQLNNIDPNQAPSMPSDAFAVNLQRHPVQSNSLNLDELNLNLNHETQSRHRNLIDDEQASKNYNHHNNQQQPHTHNQANNLHHNNPQLNQHNHHHNHQTPPTTLLTSRLIASRAVNNNPNSVNKRLSSEFEKNKFFVDLNEPPITTTLQPEEVFEELDILGTGSGGSVLKMRHKPSGKICAVKQMRRTLSEEENKRIYMDLHVVLQCECDNIVRCCGYFIKEAEVWICMELMTTCFDKLLRSRKRKPLPEKFLGTIANSAVKALYYLKERHNIIHRDVKPSNILINDQGQIKMCDFGISGRLIDSLAKTRSAGCIPYMAPERIDWDSTSYDIRADVWSLGVTLYELAVGQSPYANCNTDFDILTNIVKEPPPKLPENMNFSQELRDFLAACLTKDYRQRPKYKQLIEHEFIKRHKDTLVSLQELDNEEVVMNE